MSERPTHSHSHCVSRESHVSLLCVFHGILSVLRRTERRDPEGKERVLRQLERLRKDGVNGFLFSWGPTAHRPQP